MSVGVDSFLISDNHRRATVDAPLAEVHVHLLRRTRMEKIDREHAELTDADLREYSMRVGMKYGPKLEHISIEFRNTSARRRKLNAESEGNTSDWNDSATQAHDRYIQTVAFVSVKKPLRAVEEAQERIKQQTYGICIGCGGPIPEKRLDAVPWTSMCLECKEPQSTGPHAFPANSKFAPA